MFKSDILYKMIFCFFNPLLFLDLMTFFATFDGNDGLVKISTNTIAEVNDFHVDENAATKPDTSMGDTWETIKSGLKSWAGSLTCWWDDTDTAGQEALLVGAEVTLNLYPEGDTTGDDEMTGSAIITKVGVDQNKDGIVTRSFDFKGNGALTHGTAT